MMKHKQPILFLLLLVALVAFGCGEAHTFEQSNASAPGESNRLTEVSTTALAKKVSMNKDPKARAMLSRLDSGRLVFAQERKYPRPTQNFLLSVLGPKGQAMTFHFDPNEEISFSPKSGDGRYRWRLVRRPFVNPEAVKDLREARANGDTKLAKRLTQTLQAEGHLPSQHEIAQNITMGSFLVQDGSIVDETINEKVQSKSPHGLRGQQ